MALPFKKYQRSTDSQLEDLGTVKSLWGKGGSIRFVKKNFKTKRLNQAGNQVAVVLILQKKNGDSAMVVCSQQVSELLRSGEINHKQLLGFHVQQGERENSKTGEIEPVWYVTLPEGSEAPSISADEEIEEFENSDDFLPENFMTA